MVLKKIGGNGTLKERKGQGRAVSGDRGRRTEERQRQRKRRGRGRDIERKRERCEGVWPFKMGA